MNEGTMNMETAMPAYVGMNGPVYSQPFTCRNIRLYGFMLRADADSIQQNVCDRWFNTPSGGTERFRVASPYILLAFNQIVSITSQVPPYNDYGGFPENEVGFWTLMIDEKREQLCWTTPYLFVDSPPAIAAGREIFGFPKQWGKISMPTAPVENGQYTMDALVLQEYSAQSIGQISPVVTAQHTGDAPDTSTAGELSSLAHIMLALLKTMEGQGSLFHDLELTLNSVSGLLHGGLPMVYLKQFRDAADGSRACYQSIVHTAMQEQSFHSAAWLPPCEININSYASLPLHSDFGLPSGPLQSVLSFTTESDYALQNGAELWKA